MDQRQESSNGNGTGHAVEPVVGVVGDFPLNEAEKSAILRLNEEMGPLKNALADADMTVAKAESVRHEARLAVQGKEKAVTEAIRAIARAKGVDPEKHHINLDCDQMVLNVKG